MSSYYENAIPQANGFSKKNAKSISRGKRNKAFIFGWVGASVRRLYE